MIHVLQGERSERRYYSGRVYTSFDFIDTRGRHRRAAHTFFCDVGRKIGFTAIRVTHPLAETVEQFAECASRHARRFPTSYRLITINSKITIARGVRLIFIGRVTLSVKRIVPKSFGLGIYSVKYRAEVAINAT